MKDEPFKGGVDGEVHYLIVTNIFPGQGGCFILFFLPLYL
jgi:hypothetical protein